MSFILLCGPVLPVMGNVSISVELRARVVEFIEGDVDPGAQLELKELLSRADSGDEKSVSELQERFVQSLEFGTAGLRGLLGAGPNRMNRAVVIRTAFGLCQYLLEEVPEVKTRGLLIAQDARHGSQDFARDTAEVALAQDIPVHMIPDVVPTPVLAFMAKRLQSAASVMVTASHNPPDYNGYKVYGPLAAQIIAPMDQKISKKIEEAPAARKISRVSIEKHAHVHMISDAIPQYVEEVLRRLSFCARFKKESDIKIVYSALHGVGENSFRTLLGQAGYASLSSVWEQSKPDGNFPTLEFPNPEEKKTWTKAIELALSQKAELILVNDPDADRLGVAVPLSEKEYRILTGNEIGALLADYLLSKIKAPSRTVATTVVSSQFLKVRAEAEGVAFQKTLTGFKWLAKAALEAQKKGNTFVFGYEEALGFTPLDIVFDKDGVSSALVFASLTRELKKEGKTVLEKLEELYERYGRFYAEQHSVTLKGQEGLKQIKQAMHFLREAKISNFSKEMVDYSDDYLLGQRIYSPQKIESFDNPAPTDMLVYVLKSGGQVAVRPSGTEPKIKFYVELKLSDGSSLTEQTAKQDVQAILNEIKSVAKI